MQDDKDDLPGMLAVAKGVAEQKWPHTMDAAVWAAEYVKLNPGADEGLMLSWFANAIMAGYDTAQSRFARSAERDHLIPGLKHAAMLCEKLALNNIGYPGAIGTAGDWALEANAMRHCASELREEAKRLAAGSTESAIPLTQTETKP